MKQAKIKVYYNYLFRTNDKLMLYLKKVSAIIKSWCIIDYPYLKEQSLFNKPKNSTTQGYLETTM